METDETKLRNAYHFFIVSDKLLFQCLSSNQRTIKVEDRVSGSLPPKLHNDLEKVKLKK